MKNVLNLFVVLLISISLLAEDSKTTKKNKVNLGSVKINAAVSDNLLQVSNKFIVTGDGNVDINGILRLAGSKTGFVGFAAAPEAGAVMYTLPVADGANGEYLTTNGLGTLSWGSPYRTACPEGFNLIGNSGAAEAFCISSVQEAASTWIKAIGNCYNKTFKSHLCSASEWAMSCVADTPKNMTGHWEWVADSGSNYGRIIGLAGCDSFNGAAVDASYASRCCFR